MSTTPTAVNANAVMSDVRAAVINQKANACPMVLRLAWHASGTFDGKDGSGGSNGATMRFAPEKDDGANAGLSIVRDMLRSVKDKHPEISNADLWTLAGCAAIEFMGGPQIDFNFGRTDATSGAACPAIGRLPDALQGSQHLRDVFYRMGFNDQQIVALSGAHTLGRCHLVRSGFDGPWTRHPLKFDNTYFANLLNLTWKPRKWDGPLQYEDEETHELMMLPTDLCLIQDDKFKVWVEKYAEDRDLFFKHFAEAFGKLISNGCPVKGQPKPTEEEEVSAKFRELAMHGSVEPAQKLSAKADVHGVEVTSGRNALHKSAFWGHVKMTTFLVTEAKMKLDEQDFSGDTALHDAARFGHEQVVKILVNAGSNLTIKNNSGKTALDVANEYEKADIAALIAKGKSAL